MWWSYRYWRLTSDPMFDGMAPESWLSSSRLPSSNEISSSMSQQRDSGIVVVQVNKIGERSKGRWKRSRELIGVQLSVMQYRSGISKRACWITVVFESNRQAEVIVVQVLKIGERSNGRWKGSRELVVVKQPDIESKSEQLSISTTTTTTTTPPPPHTHTLSTHTHTLSTH